MTESSESFKLFIKCLSILPYCMLSPLYKAISHTHTERNTCVFYVKYILNTLFHSIILETLQYIKQNKKATFIQFQMYLINTLSYVYFPDGKAVCFK